MPGGTVVVVPAAGPAVGGSEAFGVALAGPAGGGSEGADDCAGGVDAAVLDAAVPDGAGCAVLAGGSGAVLLGDAVTGSPDGVLLGVVLVGVVLVGGVLVDDVVGEVVVGVPAGDGVAPVVSGAADVGDENNTFVSGGAGSGRATVLFGRAIEAPGGGAASGSGPSGTAAKGSGPAGTAGLPAIGGTESVGTAGARNCCGAGAIGPWTTGGSSGNGSSGSTPDPTAGRVAPT